MLKLYIAETDLSENERMRSVILDSIADVKIVSGSGAGLSAAEIRKTDPDVIIADIDEVGGETALRRFRSEWPNKMVILTTAKATFENAYAALRIKADDLLLKPIQPEKLTGAVAECLRAFRTDTKKLIEEKMNAAIYEVIQKRYTAARTAVADYVEALYEHQKYDLPETRREVLRFVEELNKISVGDCNFNLNRIMEEKLNQHYFIYHFQNPYALRVELMGIVDRIFDKFMDTRNATKNDIEDIVNYIDRNAHKDISLERVAEQANISSYYLSKIFRKAKGVNFVTYLTERRIEKAKEMLIHTEEPVINIAMSLSYHEPNYFSKVFKKSTGVTPSEYRKTHKQ